MKLTVLSEAKAMDGFLSEHGLSFVLEEDGKSILFDSGASDVYLRNALLLGLDISEINQIVLSHGHWDHGNGLKHLGGKALLCHPGCFEKRYRKSGTENIGLSQSEEVLRNRFHVNASVDPVQLTEKLWFLGEIPRLNDFEAKSTRYVLEDGSPDYIMDDSGLAYAGSKGLVVISGCAHSGICNMVEQSKRVTGLDQVEAVIGGFHLKAVNQQTRQTIQYLKETGVKRVRPSHCTMDPALGKFQEAFGSNEVLAGSSFTL